MALTCVRSGGYPCVCAVANFKERIQIKDFDIREPVTRVFSPNVPFRQVILISQNLNLSDQVSGAEPGTVADGTPMADTNVAHHTPRPRRPIYVQILCRVCTWYVRTREKT